MKRINLRKQGFAFTRRRFGLSQRQLAHALGVSYSALAMAEAGHRKLPTAALLKLAEMEKKMAAPEMTETMKMQNSNSGKTTDGPVPAFIKACEELCQSKAKQITRQVEAMKERHQLLSMELLAMDDAMLKIADEPGGEAFVMHMRIARIRIVKRMNGCGPVEQTFLRNKIALLNAELNMKQSERQMT